MSKASLFSRIARATEDTGNRAARRFANRYSTEGKAGDWLQRAKLDAQLKDAIATADKVKGGFVDAYRGATDHERILHPHAVDDIRENYLKAMGYVAPDDNSIRTVDDLDRWSLENWNEPYPTQEMPVPSWEDLIDEYLVDPTIKGYGLIDKRGTK